MEKQKEFSRSVLVVVAVTLLLLLVPLVGMQFSNEVNWSVSDFIVMGVLIFSIGFSYVLATRYLTNLVNKVAVGFALASTFLMIWSNLAVGLIGSGPNPGNLMYIGVLAVGLIGTILSRFTSGGMERAMYAVALALVFVAAIALVTNMDQYPNSSIGEILGVNAFFATLFGVSGLLFRYVAMEESRTAAR